MKQELLHIIVAEDSGVYDLDQDWAEILVVIELATGDDLVKLVERHLVHDTTHEIFSGFELIVLKLV